MLFQLPEARRLIAAVGEHGARARSELQHAGSGACRLDEPCATGGRALRRVLALVPARRSCASPWPRPATAAQDHDGEHEHAAVDDLQLARVDLERDQQVAAAGRSRPRRAASRSARRARPTATCRRGRPPRSRAACRSRRGSALAELHERDQRDAADRRRTGRRARSATMRTSADVDAARERRRVVASRPRRAVRRYGHAAERRTRSSSGNADREQRARDRARPSRPGGGSSCRSSVLRARRDAQVDADAG